MANSRDIACAAIAAESLLRLAPPGPVGVVDEPTGHLAQMLGQAGIEVQVWNTRAWDDQAAQAEPASGPWQAAVIRLPRERTRLALLLDLVAARLERAAPLWIVGGNDEGIKSTAKKLGPLFDGVQTVTAKKHCRLLSARRSDAPARGRLSQWERKTDLVLPGATQPVQVVAVPGVFAKGALDPATALLLEAVRSRDFQGPCLDFAAGIGLIALGISQERPELTWTLADVDSWSLHCAQLNLPQCRLALGDGWRPIPADLRFGAIFSNPPLHRGVLSDRSTLEALISGAPKRLLRGGQLIMVSQRTAGIGKRLRRAFGSAQLMNESRGFQVWGAGG
jgi:16S rRNA (guanine1207-N2)-methyltransferase